MEFLSESQIEKILNDVVELFLVPHFLALGMDATGEWRRNLEVVGNVIRGREYTIQLVNGRPPGSFVPIAPLARWASAKFGLEDREAVSMAFAVSHKIKNEGTEYYKQGGTDLLEILQSDEVIEFISSSAQSIIVQNIELQIRRDIGTI